MALYRKGEAELKENGQVIGYGTGWQDQLALIRVGATMVFLSGDKPVLGVISAIESPEKMTVVEYDGQIAARGKYLILLHDSITVEGLAQDVAETLRYYQSKETEIADAMDYLKNFDWDKLEKLSKDVIENAESAAHSADIASQSEQAASEHASSASSDAQIATDKAASASDSQAKAAESEKFSEQYMNNAKELAASASLSASAAKSSEDKVSADAKTASQASAAALQSEQVANQHRIAAEAAQAGAKESEANSKESELNANDHMVAAGASEKSAEESALSASNDAIKATEQADRAQNIADSINPEGMLKVENNLSDVSDRVQAWLNVRPVGNTPLGGDPVNPGDAATQRWVLNAIGSGATGPTMNGVMNYGVGTPSPWISRAYIPPFALPLDGQLVNRADWPELWAHAQQHGVITDSAWVADVTKRGSYSSGDGSTTFRLPDWNGASGGLANLFFRGGRNSATDKVISDSAAPNITGGMNFVYGGTLTLFDGAYGAFALNSSQFTTVTNLNSIAQAGVTPARGSNPTIDASRSSAVYGRSSSEVYPRNIAGVWIVRASGGFTAANTSWSVNNADQSAPSAGSSANGGSVRSVYKVGTSEYASADFRVKAIGGASPTAEVLLTDNSSGTSSTVSIGVGVPKSYIDGLDVRVLNSGVTVYPGSAAIGKTGEVVEVKSALTVPLPTPEASTFFYIYLYNNEGSAAVEVSKTAPVKYSGKASGKGSDTSRRFLGYYRVTSGNAVAECNMIDGLARFVGPDDANAMLRILSNGQSTVYTQVPIAGFIASGIARSIIFDGTNSAGSSGPVVAYSGVSGKTYSTFQSGVNKYEAEVFFNNPASPELWYKYSSAPGSAGFYVDIKGFRYDR